MSVKAVVSSSRVKRKDMTSKRTLLFLALLVAAVSSVLSSPQLNWNQTPWIGSSNSPLIADASDLFRTTFTTPTDDDEAATIILHIAALGVGFARINGQEVSEDYTRAVIDVEWP